MARDLIHYQVRRALEKDGWVITNDPFVIELGTTRLEVDLEAEKLFTAEKGSAKIYIEVKTFLKDSLLYDFYQAYGQYEFYKDGLKELNIDNPLFLGISLKTYKRIKKNAFLLRRISQRGVNILVVNTITETIIKWIK